MVYIEIWQKWKRVLSRDINFNFIFGRGGGSDGGVNFSLKMSKLSTAELELLLKILIRKESRILAEIERRKRVNNGKRTS